MSSSSNLVQIGDVVLVSFPVKNPQGHEQEGKRPAVVVGIPERLGTLRFPLYLVVPFSSSSSMLQWSRSSPEIYLSFPAGAGGLDQDSILLLDQLCAVDATRIKHYVGTLTPDEYKPIADGIKKMMAL